MKKLSLAVALLVLLTSALLLQAWIVSSQEQGPELIPPDQFFDQLSPEQGQPTVLSRYSPNGDQFNEGNLRQSRLGFTADVDVTNNNGQILHLTVSGRDSGLIVNYLNSTKIYFQALVADATAALGPDILYGELFLHALTETTGYSVSQYIEVRNQHPDEGRTLRQEILGLTGDDSVPDDVLKHAAAAVSDEVQRMSSAGELEHFDPEQIKYEADQLYSAAMDEPGMPILSEPIDETALQTDELLVTLELADGGQRLAPNEQFIVYYIIDPPVDNNQTIHYRALNAYSASARATASTGTVTLYMWRNSPAGYANSVKDTAGAPTPVMLTNSVPNTTNPVPNYDARVVGNQNGSAYTMYGSFGTRQCPTTNVDCT